MNNKNNFTPLILIISIIIPIVVALLYFAPKNENGMDYSFLPAVNASLNLSTSILLILGFLTVKNKSYHHRFMTSAIILSVLFLLSYILYHSTSEPTIYGGSGFLKIIYYTLLISHIILAVVIVPLVLITYLRAITQQFDKHRRLAKITLPLWLYVSISGFLIYVMISPYYK